MKKIFLSIILVMMFLVVGCSSTEETKTEETNVETSNQEAKENSALLGEVTLDEVKEAINISETLILDARPIAAFNGWTLGEEKRGGHIMSAIPYDANWLGMFETEEKLMADLERFGITKDKAIIAYGYGEDAKLLAEGLLERGFEKVSLYNGGIAEWSADESLPMENMANYDYLVPASWVNDLLAGKEVEAFDGGEYKIFEASWGPGETYAEGHIPGAVHINTDEYEVGPLWNRVSDEEILNATLANGIHKDTTVILYGADTTPAARIAIILKYLGVEDVRLLDGGYQAWTTAGYEIEKGMVDKTPITSFGVDKVPVNKDYIIDMPEANALLSGKNGRLVSIRSWVEYIGETSGYDYIEAAGRIDGAVYGYAGSDPWHMEDYRNIDNTAVSYKLIEKRWADNTILPTTSNAFYCGTGWRASETWFYAHAMGWEKVALYDGGWKEWSESILPTATGDPTK